MEVKIFDGIAGQDVTEAVLGFNPDVLGITATTPQAYDAYELADWTHTAGLDVEPFIVMGGVHPTVLPEEALKHCDCVVKGEGEKAVLQIVQLLQKKKKVPPVIEGEYIKNLDDIPSPAFDLMDIEYYMKTQDNPSRAFPFGLKHARLGSLITSRGCPYRCTFCWNSFRQTPPRWHSAERVVDEVCHFVDRYRANSIFFVDDEFAVNRKRLKKVADLFKEHGVNVVWGCQARATTLDYELMKLMGSMGGGCKFVSVGFESANQRILSFLKNNTVTVEQNEQVLAEARQAGMMIGGSFIFGSPTETKQEMLETLSFIENHEELAFIGVNVLIPYPSTEVWRLCRKKGLLPEKLDYTKLVPTSKADNTYIVCDTMSAKEFKRLVLDIQRIAIVTEKTRLVYKSSRTPVRDFLGLFRHKLYWYMVLRHPKRMASLFSKVLGRWNGGV